MNKQKWLLLVVVFVLVAGAAGFLSRVRGAQTLGAPGVKTSPIAGSRNLLVELPENVPGYTSEYIPPSEIVTNTLPRDTSFGERRYRSTDGAFEIALSVVLMGSDRTSLHKPQLCLKGGGLKLDRQQTAVVRIQRPEPYDLQVTRIDASPAEPGRNENARAVYVYWFVAEDALTPYHFQRMWWMAKTLLSQQVLQRWAYVSCIAWCQAGQEDATFERMKPFIADAVPEFQLVPRPPAGFRATALGTPTP